MMDLFDTIVERIGKMHVEGNIIPTTWYRHPLLRFRSGKPNTVAITILGDILYWYRPTEIRDDSTGRVVGRRKKFKADKLQKSYASWADLFGFTRNQVKAAVDFLRARGLVQTELRDLPVQGLTLRNVMFVEPVPAKVAELMTIPPDDAIDGVGDANGGPVESTTSPDPDADVVDSGAGGSPLDSGTNTETKEITTETTIEPPIPPERGQVASAAPDGFRRFWDAWPKHPRKVARRQCLRKWCANDLEASADRIVQAVEAAKRSRDWTKDGGQYVPMPLTWLNQGRWEAASALAQTQGNPDDQLLVPGSDWKPRRLTDEERAALRTLKAPKLKIKPVIPDGFVPPPAAPEGGGQ